MSGLRAKVEGLNVVHADKDWISRDEVLAAIPEGAVLVTQETLAAALVVALEHMEPVQGGMFWNRNEVAAAILRHLREGT